MYLEKKSCLLVTMENIKEIASELKEITQDLINAGRN